MRSRRNARETALQALFQCDTLECWSNETVDVFFERFTREGIIEEGTVAAENFAFTRSLISGVIANMGEIDGVLSDCSTHWQLNRMSRVDRNILRIAAFEILKCDDIPVNVSINEAIEVAKRFSAEDSPNFVNGLLDKLASSFKASKAAAADEKRPAVMPKVVNH